MNMLKALCLLFLMIGAANAAEPAHTSTPPALVNINTADAATLATLTGVGAKKAEEIIKYRQAHGGFKTVEEFAKVHGIGPKTFEANRSRLTVGEVKTTTPISPTKENAKSEDLKPTSPSVPSTAHGLMPKM